MTSLNGLGFSISLLKIADLQLGGGPELLELLDAPAEASGWSAAISSGTWQKRGQAAEERRGSDAEEIQPSTLRGQSKSAVSFQLYSTNCSSVDPSLAQSALKTALKRLISVEPDVTKYDTIVGDGDCGIGLKRGAECKLHITWCVA